MISKVQHRVINTSKLQSNMMVQSSSEDDDLAALLEAEFDAQVEEFQFSTFVSRSHTASFSLPHNINIFNIYSGRDASEPAPKRQRTAAGDDCCKFFSSC